MIVENLGRILELPYVLEIQVHEVGRANEVGCLGSLLLNRGCRQGVACLILCTSFLVLIFKVLLAKSLCLLHILTHVASVVHATHFGVLGIGDGATTVVSLVSTQTLASQKAVRFFTFQIAIQIAASWIVDHISISASSTYHTGTKLRIVIVLASETPCTIACTVTTKVPLTESAPTIAHAQVSIATSLPGPDGLAFAFVGHID